MRHDPSEAVGQPCLFQEVPSNPEVDERRRGTQRIGDLGRGVSLRGHGRDAAHPAARKLSARQAQLLRDQRRQQIVDSCARMFVVDRAGYERCVQTQAQAAPAP